MALFSVDFYSKSLFRPVNFKLFVPNDVPPEMKMGNTSACGAYRSQHFLFGKCS